VKTPYVLPRPPRNRYLVRERDRRRMNELLRLGAAIVVVGAALLAYTWLHLQLLGSGYRVEVLEQRLQELQRQERHLRLEASYLSSPQRVETRATQELGMQAPELQQLLFVRADGQVVSAVTPKKVPLPAPVESAAPPAEEPAR
jgi:cell division protein FtsL